MWFFFFAISAVLTQRKKRLTWGDKGRATEWVSLQPQIPAAGWVACQLPSELRNLSSARFSPSLHIYTIQIYCIHQDRTHQIPWKQNTLSCTNTGLLQCHYHALEQKGRAVAVEGLWTSSICNIVLNPSFLSQACSARCLHSRLEWCEIFDSGVNWSQCRWLLGGRVSKHH